MISWRNKKNILHKTYLLGTHWNCWIQGFSMNIHKTSFVVNIVFVVLTLSGAMRKKKKKHTHTHKNRLGCYAGCILFGDGQESRLEIHYWHTLDEASFLFFFNQNVFIFFFLVLHENISCIYSLEVFSEYHNIHIGHCRSWSDGFNYLSDTLLTRAMYFNYSPQINCCW